MSSLYEKLQSTAKELVESHRLQLNTVTGFGIAILGQILSGSMPVQNNDLIKHTEI